MQNHVFGLVHRLVAPGCVCRSITRYPSRFWRHHPPRTHRNVSTITTAVLEVQDGNNDTRDTDSFAFRPLVQSWREHYQAESTMTPVPATSSRAPRTSAASRHRRRLETALNGELTTPPSQLSSAQVSIQEFCRSEPYYIETLPHSDTTFVSDPLSQQPRQPTLYQILLNRIHTHTSLSSLVTFHAAQPSWRRTTRTYNLLISHALRHASFSTADTLFILLRRDGLKPTQQTEKLFIRFRVLTGRWAWAWRTVTARYGGVQNVPLSLWMEFFGGMKRGAFRNRGSVVVEDERVVRNRARELLRLTPSLSPKERAEMPPRTAYAIVRLMLTLGRKEKAQIFTRDYIRSLPEHLEDETILEICRRTVELHIVYPARLVRLSDFYERRKLVLDLFSLHEKVTPTPQSLYLLLASLRHSKRPWASIQETLHVFQRKWGSVLLNDRPVHRLLTQLALKAGQTTDARRWISSAKSLPCVDTRHSLSSGRRLKGKELYRRSCREKWRWKKLERRVSKASK